MITQQKLPWLGYTVCSNCWDMENCKQCKTIHCPCRQEWPNEHQPLGGA